MKKIFYILFLIPLFLADSAFGTSAQTFETYATGMDLLTQTGWTDVSGFTPANWAKVVSTPVHGGVRSFSVNDILTSSNNQVGWDLDSGFAVPDGDISLYVRPTHAGVNTDQLEFGIGGNFFKLGDSEGTHNGGKVYYKKAGYFYTQIGTYTADNWYLFEIQWRDSTDLVRFQFNSTGWTEWLPATIIAPTSITFAYSRWLNLYHYYVDDIIESYIDCTLFSNPSSCAVDSGGLCWWDSMIFHSCLPTAGITNPCSYYTSEEACDVHSDDCHWQTIPLLVLACMDNIDYTPVSYYEECEEVPVTGWFTLPAIFDIPCQLHNASNYLFADDPEVVSASLLQLKNDTLNIFPVGYVTRFIDILNDTTPVEPPAITYTLGTGITNGTDLTGSYTFQVFDHVDDTINDITDDVSGKNIWDVFMPYWNVVIYLSLFIVLLTTILGAHLGHTIESSMHSKNHKNDKKETKK